MFVSSIYQIHKKNSYRSNVNIIRYKVKLKNCRVSLVAKTRKYNNCKSWRVIAIRLTDQEWQFQLFLIAVKQTIKQSKDLSNKFKVWKINYRRTETKYLPYQRRITTIKQKQISFSLPIQK